MNILGQRPNNLLQPDKLALSEFGDEEEKDEVALREPYLEGNLHLVRNFSCPEVVMCCRYSPDGTVLAVGLIDGNIKIYQPETGVLLHGLRDNETLTSHKCVTSIHFLPFDGDEEREHKHFLMATYVSGCIKFWHYTSGTCVFTIDEGRNRHVLNAAFNRDGDKFVTVGEDAAIHLYDENTKQKIRTCEASDTRDKMNGHRARIFSVKYHPWNVNEFISGGWDDTVQFWDDRESHSSRSIYGPHICGDALDIDPVHDHILTGSWRKDQVLQIWDYKKGTLLKDVPHDHMHQSLLYCAQWLGKEHIVCGGSDQNMARIIDRGTLNTVGQLVDLPKGVFCIDNDNSMPKPRLAVCSDKTIFILKSEQKRG